MRISCVNIVQNGDKVLALKVKGKLELPGGKWEESDSGYPETAKRELKEETNLDAVKTTLFWHAPSDTAGYYVYLFLTEVKNFDAKDMGEGKPVWVYWHQLQAKARHHLFYSVCPCPTKSC